MDRFRRGTIHFKSNPVFLGDKANHSATLGEMRHIADGQHPEVLGSGQNWSKTVLLGRGDKQDVAARSFYSGESFDRDCSAVNALARYRCIQSFTEGIVAQDADVKRP